LHTRRGGGADNLILKVAYEIMNNDIYNRHVFVYLKTLVLQIAIGVIKMDIN